MSTIEDQNIKRLRGYLAGPLFSDAERTFNLRVAELLEDFLDVYLPQRDGGLMSEMITRLTTYLPQWPERRSNATCS